MGRNYLIIMIAVGLMAAFLGRMPTPGKGASSPEASAEAQSSSDAGTPGTQFAQSGSGRQLVLERRGDGHFYADVEVNGVPISMLVDTGASGVALSAEDARRAGVATSIGMHDVVGEGASGAVHGDVVTIERIRLGGIAQSAVPAVVLKGGSTSLLGQSFLRDFDSVEISGDRMHLR
jgi:aspartyl protease family protein